MSASAAITITVEGTMAPNGYGSPSFSPWANNAAYAVENNLSSYGAAGPAQFNVVTGPLPVADNFVTGFNSWLGQAPGPYAGELGNRASFVSVINGNGSLISINNLSVTMSSTDPWNGLGWTWAAGTFNYSYKEIGIIDNPDGSFTYVTSGSSSQLVNEIISIGVGNAYAGYLGDAGPGATDQQIIDYDLAGMPGYFFTGTFNYLNTSGSDTIDFTAVPEPTTMIAGALLLLPFGASTLRVLRKNRTA